MSGVKEFVVHEEFFLGKGRRRSCYRIPGSDKCVKFYNLPHQIPSKLPGIKREVAWRRFLKYANINYREWHYYQKLRLQAPPQLVAAFPEHLELVYCPVKGWGTIANVIANYDGSAPRRVTNELADITDPELCLAVYRATEQLCEELVKHTIRFFDYYNILVQWTAVGEFSLRIVDFEPVCRSPIPGLTKIGFYVRHKCRGRVRRYLARMRGVMAARVPPIVYEKNKP